MQSGWLIRIHRTVPEKSSRWPLEEEKSDEQSDERVMRREQRFEVVKSEWLFVGFSCTCAGQAPESLAWIKNSH